MTQELAMTTTQLDLLLDLKCGEHAGHTVTERGIIFDPNIGRDDYLSIATKAADDVARSGAAHAVAMFRLGDALRFGEDRFGEEYAQAIDLSREGLKQHAKTITNAAWIAGRISAEIRHVETLSLTHHELVAALPQEEQIKFLTDAEREGWNTKELRAEIRKVHPAKRRTGPKKNAKTKTTTEAEALKAGETVLVFLLDAVGAAEPGSKKPDTKPYKDWPADRKKKWGPWFEEILKLSRRCIQNGVKKG